MILSSETVFFLDSPTKVETQKILQPKTVSGVSNFEGSYEINPVGNPSNIFPLCLRILPEFEPFSNNFGFFLRRFQRDQETFMEISTTSPHLLNLTKIPQRIYRNEP